jgi:LacI family transcriptional regulator
MGESAEKEDRILGMLKSRRVDGLLIASAHSARTRNWKQAFANLAVPVVFMDRRFPQLHFVRGDDEAIGLQATNHLAEQGHRRIAHISGPRTVATAIGRRKGYLKALQRLSVAPAPELVIESNYHEESGGFEAMRRLLNLPSPADAVFCGERSDRNRSHEAALDRGLRPPEQFGLIGVGGHHYGKYLQVPLSTVEQQRFRIGQNAAEMLIEFINGREPAASHTSFGRAPPPHSCLIRPLTTPSI